MRKDCFLSTKTKLQISSEPDQVIISGSHFSIVFDSQTGFLSQYVFQDRELIKSPLRPNLWRVWIDNDISTFVFYPWLKPFLGKHFWRLANQKLRCTHFQAQALDDCQILVEAEWRVPGGKTPFKAVFNITGDGTLQVETSFTARKELERIGMQISLPKEFQQVTYFGLGPQETMPDRLSGARVGNIQNHG